MEIRTAQSRQDTAAIAISDLHARLELHVRPAPDFVALHFAPGLDAGEMADIAPATLGARALHAGTSCLGVMGVDGLCLDGTGSGAFAIWDPGGSYGTASADLGDDPARAARDALLAALKRADRPGELPEMVWLSISPGREEAVLDGLRSVLGSETLIVGGSAADNDLTGQWAVCGPDGVYRDGIVVSVLFPTCPIVSVFTSGYAPIGPNGIVTKASGRTLMEVDGRPAATVLHDWSEGIVPLASDVSQPILTSTVLFPLGRVLRHVAGVPFHLILHPATVWPDGSVDLQADVAVGDRLWQMRGSDATIRERAEQVAASAHEMAGGAATGALMVCCAGWTLAMRDRLEEVSISVSEALGGVPWICIFSFGEQGMPTGEGAHHGNLMISCSVVARSRD